VIPLEVGPNFADGDSLVVDRDEDLVGVLLGVVEDYVPRHIVLLLFPLPLCGHP
jgi:hypothetical protein